MVRGKGSARVEMGVKATARPNTTRITRRRGPCDTLDDDLSTITISAFFFGLGMRSGMERTESALFRFAAVHMILGSQLDPFYLLERKAPTLAESSCKRSA